MNDLIRARLAAIRRRDHELVQRVLGRPAAVPEREAPRDEVERLTRELAAATARLPRSD